MKNAVVVNSNFVAPHFIEELGCDGLSLHEVAESIGVQFGSTKEKFERMVSENRIKSTFNVYTATVKTGALSKQIVSYYLATDTAKFFLAKWDSELGDAYCRYLIECEKAVESIAELSPELRFLIKLEKQQKDQQKQLTTLQSVMTQCSSTLEDSCLTSTQIQELENLFSELRKVSNNDFKLVSRTKGALKAQFLTCCKTGMTYKDISTRHFEACKAMIQTQIAQGAHNG